MLSLSQVDIENDLSFRPPYNSTGIELACAGLDQDDRAAFLENLSSRPNGAMFDSSCVALCHSYSLKESTYIQSMATPVQDDDSVIGHVDPYDRIWIHEVMMNLSPPLKSHSDYCSVDDKLPQFVVGGKAKLGELFTDLWGCVC